MSRACLAMIHAHGVTEMATAAHYGETPDGYYEAQMDKAFLKLADAMGYEVKRIVPAITSAPGFDNRATQVAADDREQDIVLR